MKSKFEEIFQCEVEQEYFSPGRVNLIGEHIDYNGGMVLPMAIDVGTYGMLAMRSDKLVRVYSMNFADKGVIEFTLDDLINKPTDDWANYVKAVIYVFENSGYQINYGFDLLVNGTIPNSSGLSSSASLEVLIGRILIDNFNLSIDDIELSLLTQKAENQFIGVNCGIMDQFIIANASKEGALLIDTNKLTKAIVRFNLNGQKIVILNSNKKRGLVDSAYNERRRSCELALEIAKAYFPVDNLCELTLDQLEQLPLNEVDYQRVKHVVTESIRVDKSIVQLSQGQIEDFGQTLSESHNSLRDDFAVSCEELDFIVEECIKLGALGARMTGAGFGGCVISVMNEETIMKLNEVKEKYQEQYGLTMDIIIAKAADKAHKVK